MKTGNEAIDRLQSLQLESQTYANWRTREAFVCDRIDTVPFEQLLDQCLQVVTEGDVYGRNPDQTPAATEKFSDIGFYAPAAGVHYLKRAAPAFEGIIVNFVFPKITEGVAPEKVKQCYDLTIMTPVLAIKSCKTMPRRALQK